MVLSSLREAIISASGLSLVLASSLFVSEFNVNNSTVTNANIDTWLHGNDFHVLNRPDGNKMTWQVTPTAVSSVTANLSIYGAKDSENVSNNSVYFTENRNDDTVKYTIYGANSTSKDARNNAVYISNLQTLFQAIHGGYSQLGEAYGNKVNLENISPVGDVIGGFAGGNASHNEIIISGTSNKLGDLSVIGGKSINGDALNNKVTISSLESISKSIIGGWGFNGANANEITILGNIKQINKDIYGGQSDNGDANYNKITIEGDITINDFDDNLVREYNGRIVGGYGNKQTRNNVINLNKSGLNLKSIEISGGSKEYVGNILNVRGKNIALKNISNFEKINFYLPIGTKNGDTVLDTTNILHGQNGTDAYDTKTDLSNSKIAVRIEQGANSLNKGDSVNLLKTKNGIVFGADMENHKEQLVQSGLSTAYTFVLEKSIDEKILLAKVSDKKSINDLKPAARNNSKLMAQNKNTAETGVSVMGIVNQGSDVLSGVDISSTSVANSDISSFGNMGGNSVIYNSGSHVDSKGFSGVVGAAKILSDISYGGFVEFGGGKYDSFNDFGIKGNGNIKYLGVGLVDRFNLRDNFYVNSSVKMGRINSDYESYLASDKAEYDISRSYFGLNVGGGKTFELTSNSYLDTYINGFYTRIAKANTTILGEEISYKAMKSLRAQIGARYNYMLNDSLSAFAGAALEHEFDGKAKAVNKTYNTDITSPSVKGNTLTAEVGLRVINDKFDTNI